MKRKQWNELRKIIVGLSVNDQSQYTTAYKKVLNEMDKLDCEYYKSNLSKMPKLNNEDKGILEIVKELSN